MDKVRGPTYFIVGVGTQIWFPTKFWLLSTQWLYLPHRLSNGLPATEIPDAHQLAFQAIAMNSYHQNQNHSKESWQRILQLVKLISLKSRISTRCMGKGHFSNQMKPTQVQLLVPPPLESLLEFIRTMLLFITLIQICDFFFLFPKLCFSFHIRKLCMTAGDLKGNCLSIILRIPSIFGKKIIFKEIIILNVERSVYVSCW